MNHSVSVIMDALPAGFFDVPLIVPLDADVAPVPGYCWTLQPHCSAQAQALPPMPAMRETGVARDHGKRHACPIPGCAVNPYK
jgi:hypothetical protein